MLVGIRPDDGAFRGSSGVVFHPQDENNNGNIAYYEITSTSDEIDFNIAQYIAGLDNPVLRLHTQWGATDFDLVDTADSQIIISEISGFDNDVWFVDVSGTSGTFRITQFDTSQVTGTEAAWLPYVGIFDLEV